MASDVKNVPSRDGRRYAGTASARNFAALGAFAEATGTDLAWHLNPTIRDGAGVFERWVEEKAPLIDPTLDPDAYSLEYTELYEEFKALYEGLLEKYIVKEGSSVEEFYAELREATERDEDSSEALMGQIMLATTDFDVFMLMMKESRGQYDVKERSRHK